MATTGSKFRTKFVLVAGPLRDALVYDPRGDWSQTAASEPSAVAVWGYLHAPAAPDRPGLRDIEPEVRAAVEQTALLDLLLPALLRYGAEKQAMYFIGPEGAEYLRIALYADAAGHADRLYPGHNDSPFWSSYFPGVVDGWRRWLADPARMRDPAAQVTGTAPYTDAGGNGAIMTLFQPLWDASRARFAGAVGVDVTLGQSIRYVQDLRLAGSGFAFLAQENGNVFAVHDDGQHEEAVVVRRGGSIERIDTVDLGVPVGLEVDIAAFIARTELRLSPGDVVVLYTDGITEAEDIHGEQYGIDRLCELVRRAHERPAAEIKQAIIDDVMRFIGAQKVFDDITTVVIKRR